MIVRLNVETDGDPLRVSRKARLHQLLGNGAKKRFSTHSHLVIGDRSGEGDRLVIARGTKI